MVEKDELQSHNGMYEEELVVGVLCGCDVEQLLEARWLLLEVFREAEDGGVVVEERNRD